VGDLVYIGSCSGTLFALDRHDGHVHWTFNVKHGGRPASFHGDPLIADGMLVIGTDRGTQEDPTSHVWAVDLATGALRWKCVVGNGIVSDIIGDGNLAIAVTRADSLLCLDLATGRRVWTFAGKVPSSDVYLFRSPAVGGGRVFFGGTDETVRAFDLQSGRLLWERPLGTPISSGVLLAGDELMLTVGSGTVYRIDQATGAVRGQFPVGRTFVGPPVAVGDSLVLLGGDRSIACVDRSKSLVRWEQMLLDGNSSSRPYVWRGMVLVGTEKGELQAFHVSDGTRQWSHSFTGVIRGIGRDQGDLYVGTQAGVLYAYRRFTGAASIAR
jgi:outer membrane protein assembly factor BamB